MTCPKCTSDTSVIETRTVPAGTRRRRQCDQCAARFSTVEQVVPDNARYDEAMAFVPRQALLSAIEEFRKLVMP